MWHHHPLTSEAYIFCKPETHLLRNLYTYICVSVCVCVYMYVLSCVWLCNLMDCSLPGSFVHGISQARILEWVAISGFRGSSWPRAQKPLRLHLLNWQVDSLPLCHLGSTIYIYIHIYIYIYTHTHTYTYMCI